jgi:riboflavin synthase
MFTGIIEVQGIIKKIAKLPQAAQITIESTLPPDQLSPGDSIAVDGVCLTLTTLTDKEFIADISPETLKRTTLGAKRQGSRVNLERALKLSDRLGGHLVTGHIDGIASIKSITSLANAIQIYFAAPDHILHYLVEKGSVAIDGISLTVNQCTDSGFNVMIIPFTASHTTLEQKKPGDKVNVENDIIGKYVEKFLLSKNAASQGTITQELLDKYSFT